MDSLLARFRAIPPVTRALLFVVVVGWIANALAGHLGFDAIWWTRLVPSAVRQGELWRLLTYPWLVAGEPLALIFGALMLGFFGAPLEASWGSRGFSWRLALLVGVPAVATVLVLWPTNARDLSYSGLAPLGVSLLTAFASRHRQARIALFPLPIAIEADQFLWLEAALLMLYAIAGGVVGLIPEFFAFGFALAWFRLGLDLGLRRSWLKFRAGRIEAGLAKARRQRGLRIVRDDDDQRYLH